MISSVFNFRFSLRSLIGIGVCAVVLCFEFVELQVEARPLPTPTGLNYQALLTPFGKPSAATILNSTYTPNVQAITTDITEVDVFPESVGHILIEVPGPILTPNPALPPTDGVYSSPSQVWAEYVGSDLQIVLQDVRLRPLADPPPVVTTVGADEVQTFQMMATGTVTLTGPGFVLDSLPVELTGPAETVAINKAGQTTGQFDAEIVSMELTGEITAEIIGVVPIVMRESPTLASGGGVIIGNAESGFSIDSFFDVFTGLSVDGGDTWIASNGSVAVVLVQPWLIPASVPPK